MAVKFIMSVVLLMTALSAAAQKDSSLIPPPPPPIQDADSRIFDKVEVEARFPGGDAEWRHYLERTLNAFVPVDNGAPAGTYTVVVQFIVSKDGSITDVRALTKHGYGMEKEVIRVIQKGPNWVPAQVAGMVVKAYRKQPVTFMIEEEGKRKRKNKD